MKINIMSVRQLPSADPGRLYLKDTLVTYGIEGRGTEFVIIPSENPGPKEIQAAIASHLKTLIPAEGQSFEVP